METSKIALPSRMVTAIEWGVIAMVCLVPLPYGSNRPLPWSLLAWVTGILLLLWTVSACKDRENVRVSLRHIWYIVIPFFLMIGVVIWQLLPLSSVNVIHPLWFMAGAALPLPVSQAVTLDRYQTWEGLMKLVTYGGVFWLALQLGRSSTFSSKIWKALAYSIALYAFIGLVMYGLGIEAIWSYKKKMYLGTVTSTFINRNSFATYAGIGILINLALIYDIMLKQHVPFLSRQFYRHLLTEVTTKGLPFILCTVAIFCALVLTYSRAGIASFFVACSTFFILSGITWLVHSRWKLILGMVGGIVLVGYFAISVGGEELFRRLSWLDKEVAVRNQIYHITWNAIHDFWLMGSGLGTFEEVFLMYRDNDFPFFLTERIDHAHNTYLEMMLEVGIPAFTLLVLSIAFMVVHCMKGLIQRKRGVIYPLTAIAVSMLVWVHAFFDFSIEMPAIALTYAVVMGVGCAQSWSSQQHTSDRVHKEGGHGTV